MGYARAHDAGPDIPHDDASPDLSGDTARRAAAEQPAPAGAVEPVRFVAPDPTLLAEAPAAMPRAVPESASGADMGYARADDDSPDVPANSAIPPADDTASPDLSGDAAMSPLPSNHDVTASPYSVDDSMAPAADYTIMYGARVRPRRTCRVIGSTCTMGQHHAYFPPMHGYYYFHPYHHSHVWRHQAFAQLWGEDPAHPYANRVFEMVYEQYRADTVPEQPLLDD